MQTTTSSPVIGVTTYATNNEDQFSLPTKYVDAVRFAGGVPLLIAPGETRLDALLARVDGLILTGGGDIDPNRYGGKHHETIYMVDTDRDEMELTLARHAIRFGKPTLAICRGTQVVNVALGGTLHPHLPDVVGQKVKHRLPPRKPTLHAVGIESDSQLARILGTTECSPASWHHQGIRDLADGLKAVAYAPDGIIEAVEKPDNPRLIAVQWHPELTAAEDPLQQRLFARLVRIAGNAHPCS
jgi:putative glutamine amidotransferase